MFGDETIHGFERYSAPKRRSRNFGCDQDLHDECLARIADVGGEAVARAISRDKSRISKIVGDAAGVKLKFMASFFNAIGLRVVDAREYEHLQGLLHSLLGERMGR